MILPGPTPDNTKKDDSSTLFLRQEGRTVVQFGESGILSGDGRPISPWREFVRDAGFGPKPASGVLRKAGKSGNVVVGSSEMKS